MELEVGMYVRTKWGYICKIININDFREPSMKYGVEASYLKDIMFIGDDDISKASHSLLGNNEEPCLIEEDDYVNGDIVTKIKEDEQNNKYIVTIFNDVYYDKDIKSIVTKEMFSSMSYKVGDGNESNRFIK